MSPEEIAGAVKVRGRGGTKLQPGLDLLERDKRLPKDAPILIITDGDCELPFDDVESLLEMITDVLSSRASTIRIGSEALPVEAVKRRFRQLDGEHIKYVIDSMRQTTAKIVNIRAYLLTALYNAPVTIGPYYSAAAQHDFGKCVSAWAC